MNMNEFAADDAEGAPANDAADDDEDDDNGSVVSVVNAADEMDLALGYIGFDNINVRDRLRNEGLQDFSDLNIRDIAESFTKRTIGDGRFLFGIWRTRLLIGMIHWVQDFSQVGETPSMNNYLGHPGLFRDALSADLRKIEHDQSDTVSKAADPGKFKDERKWPEWEPSFVNYLSTLHGVSGVPLSYVVRAKEIPDPRTNYQNFNERAIACAPLSGPTYQANSRKVHQLLKSFLQSETIIIIEIKLLYCISTSVLKLQLMPLKPHPCVTPNHGKYSCPGN